MAVARVELHRALQGHNSFGIEHCALTEYEWGGCRSSGNVTLRIQGPNVLRVM